MPASISLWYGQIQKFIEGFLFQEAKQNLQGKKVRSKTCVHVEEVAWWINTLAKSKCVFKIFIKIKSFWRGILNHKSKRRKKENNSTKPKDNGEFQGKCIKLKHCLAGIDFFLLKCFSLIFFLRVNDATVECFLGVYDETSLIIDIIICTYKWMLSSSMSGNF